jgi:hypothetical protein
VNFRYYLQPSSALAGGIHELDFNNATNTWPEQIMGRQDAANAVSKGEGWLFKHMDMWRD